MVTGPLSPVPVGEGSSLQRELLKGAGESWKEGTRGLFAQAREEEEQRKEEGRSPLSPAEEEEGRGPLSRAQEEEEQRKGRGRGPLSQAEEEVCKGVLTCVEEQVVAGWTGSGHWWPFSEAVEVVCCCQPWKEVGRPSAQGQVVVELSLEPLVEEATASSWEMEELSWSGRAGEISPEAVASSPAGVEMRDQWELAARDGPLRSQSWPSPWLTGGEHSPTRTPHLRSGPPLSFACSLVTF